MSVNTAHANNGVLLHAGEFILLFSDKVTMEFSGQDNPLFNGTKHGRIYLTSHRMVFNSKKATEPMLSFSCPFVAMSDVELEQPVFGSNYIKGKVRAQPNGNFIGEVKFKLHFNAGGAIEYGQAMLRAASMAQRNMREGGVFSDDPPPYTPSGAWHEAPPPAYQPPPGYYGWLPAHSAFTGPPPNSVFISDNPPPYAGIGGPPPYAGHQAYPAAAPLPNYPSGFQQQSNSTPGGQPGFQPATTYNPATDQPSWGGFSLPPPEQPRQQAPQQPLPGYPSAPQPQQWGGGGGGYPGVQPPPYGYQPPGGGFSYPGGPAGGPPGGYGGVYPSAPSQGGGGIGAAGTANGAMGFSAPPPNTKEAEAMQSGYQNPSNQRNDNMPPPSYNDLPHGYTNYDSRKHQ